jgi:methionine-rich copper-binding protein CopC
MMRRPLATLCVSITTLALAAGVATAGARHLKLLRSIPAANASVPAGALPPVQLWFSQRPELAVTSVKLKPAAGDASTERTLAPLARGAARTAPIVAQTTGVTVAPGAYVLTWRTMARDGHVLSGTIPFTVTATHSH